MGGGGFSLIVWPVSCSWEINDPSSNGVDVIVPIDGGFVGARSEHAIMHS